MVRLSEPVLDVIHLADQVQAHLPKPSSVRIARLLSELDTIVTQDRVDPAGHGFQQVLKEFPRRSPISLVDQLGDGELAGAVDADEQVEFAFGSLYLGNIHVEEADRIALEALALRLIALDVRQTGDTVPLQAAVQR